MLPSMLQNDTQATVLDHGYVSPVRHATTCIWQMGVPLVILLGTFGNIMILLIQRREYSTSHSTMSIFFICLAISDLTSLWFDPFFWWLETVEVHINSDIMCKVRVFSTYFTGHMSASILVTMTAQKAASILWPHKVNVLFTRRFAKSLMIGVLAFFVIVNAHLLYGITVYENSGNTTGRCFYAYVSWEYSVFFDNYWGWIDTFFCSIAPTALLVIANSVLIWKVGQSLQEARRQFSAGNDKQLRARKKKTSSMTLTLIATSVAFLFLTSPVSVYFMLKGKFMEGADNDPNIADANYLVFAALHLLWLGNNAVTFYLYCLTGAKYRQKFLSVICLQRGKNGSAEKSTKTAEQPSQRGCV